MLVRSSKYLEALTRRDEALTTAERALKEARRWKHEAEKLAREAQEAKDDYLHRLLFKRVVVHVKVPEISIDGILAAVYSDSIVVKHAKTMISPVDVEQLEGDQVIPLIQVAWVQDISLGNVRA
jgi:hypothetical protein